MAGQFAAADSVLPGGGFDLWGLSRYAYVEGNPVNRTDPNGHCYCDVPGTGDNFFPQSGGRLLDGNTGDVFIGPSPTPVYHIYVGHPHHYAPYRPYGNRPPKRSTPLFGPHSACPIAAACMNAEPAGKPAASRPVTPIGSCGLGVCGLVFGSRAGGTGSGGLKGMIAAALAGGGAEGCGTDPEECQQIEDQIQSILDEWGGKIGSAGGRGLGRGFTSTTKNQEYEDAGGLCRYCGDSVSRGDAEFDHGIPKSQLGNNTLANCNCSCSACNGQKLDSTVEEYATYLWNMLSGGGGQ